MKTIVAIVISSVMLSALQPAPTADERAVRAVIQQYFRGHSTGDPAEMRKVFWPTAHIEGIREGKFFSMTVDEYCARFPGKSADDESSRKRTIDRIEVSGTAAAAGATLVQGGFIATDYFVLLKVDGTWKIANKVFSSRPAK